MSNLEEEIKSIITPEITTESVAKRYLKRLSDGNYTRDENLASHYCVYFLTYNKRTKQIFLGHHKKSGLWLSPGGHIDKGEKLMDVLSREIYEELGIENKAKEQMKPFLFTITPIINQVVGPCKEHFDIWYRIPTDGSDFNVDPAEFHATRWLTIDEARKIVIDKSNLEALDKMEDFFKS